MTESLLIYCQGLLVVLSMMTALWIVSVFLKNASIVDLFWGLGFAILAVFYFLQTDGGPTRRYLVVTLAAIWGLRLSIYLAKRNIGKGEDFRYQNFRSSFGPERYWWVSFFQVFLLQGILMWLVSAPLLGAQLAGPGSDLNVLDALAVVLWIVGFVFEAGSDWQLSRFKEDASNKGTLLTTGFWRYTRHPNYFGDSAVWWGFGLLSLAAGHYWWALGSVLMTLLIIKVSGVALLEKTSMSKKHGYREYAARTSAFLPWFPKKKID